MDEKEGKIFLDRAEKIVQGLTKALAKELGKLNDDEFSTELMLYAMAKFSAGALLSIQEQTKEFHIEDDFGETIKELMAIMGKNLALVINFMQMKEFKRKFKNGEIEWIYN